MSMYQLCLVHQKNARVCLQIDALGSLDNLQSSDRDVSLICETKTDEMQHVDGFN